MPVVTALRATRGARVAVHVDGAFLCAASDALVARWRLYQGRELDEAALARLRLEASSELVVADAYRLLGHRARSRQELCRRLLAKGHAAQAVDTALDALATEGIIDDAAFARSYVADKRRLAGWGAERIRRGLEALGVEPDVVRAALGGDVADEDDGGEVERALAVLARRGAPQAPLEAARRRAYQALLRRGFAPPVAYAAVRVWSGDPSARPD